MQDHTEPDAPPSNLFFTVFPSIMLPMFLAVVDQTIVATALPAIAAATGDVGRRGDGRQREIGRAHV